MLGSGMADRPSVESTERYENSSSDYTIVVDDRRATFYVWHGFRVGISSADP